MPDPDEAIQNRDLATGAVDSRVLADSIETTDYTATGTMQGAIIRTDTAGDYLFMSNGNILMFTGNSLEERNGLFRVVTSGAGNSATLQAELHAPNWNTSGDAAIVVRSESNDDSTTPPGWVFLYTGGSTQTAQVVLQAVDLLVQNGKATIEDELVIPALTSDPSSPADGNMWLHTTDNAVYIWEGGARRTVASW